MTVTGQTDVRAEYLEELREKTLQRGRAFAVIAFMVLVAMLFQDTQVLKAPALATAFRPLGLACTGFFLIASFILFRRRPCWIIPAHAVQITSVLVQICGFTCVMFYVRPPDLPTYPYGTTSAILISMVAAFAFAYGARRLLWAVLAIPLALTIAFLLLFCSVTGEELALFSNPVAVCPALIAVAISQERTAFKEFHMRRLALHRQAELEITAEALLESNRELEHFSRAASHDLRQPLNSITGYLNVMREMLPGGYEGRDQVKDCMDRTVQAADRMERLISDLLAYSRLDAEQKAFADTDMNAVLDEALQNLDRVLHQTDAVIRRGKLPTVSGNATLLVTVLQNLIGNAVKYRRIDTVPEIDVSVEQTDGVHRISVNDNGIGFEPRFAQEVFEPFRRLHTRQEYDGTGVGLASCLKIVRQHGGTMEAKSRPGSGSTFSFTLPAIPQA
jgi:signal transduction histidine kinase